ncbi:hypothetical protein MFIFM68171_04955 [Madurella fahalii]|uniref:Uncharacterized protein n=1 Tax=Madurella fahalii TaxID=1157608 RepID=A0ABQ0GAY0_9PEZI
MGLAYRCLAFTTPANLRIGVSKSPIRIPEGQRPYAFGTILLRIHPHCQQGCPASNAIINALNGSGPNVCPSTPPTSRHSVARTP